MGIKVQSADVAVNEQAFKTVSSAEMLRKMNLSNIEATSIPAEQNYVYIDPYIQKSNHFLLMLQMAFSQHKCVQISPDDLWLLVCQGFAQHVQVYPEKFRNLISTHEGKITIQVRRNDFIKGKPNQWEEIFPEFTKNMQEHMTQDLHSKLVLKFSTTTLKESTAFEISFMETMSNYFEYEFLTLCGIPEIHLEGTVEDYEKIIDSCKSLFNFGIDPWLNKVIAVIEKIIGAFNGERDLEFWSSIFKQKNESGGPYVTGWILNFFPYIKYNLYKIDGKNELSEVVQKEDILKYLHEENIKNTEYTRVTVLIKNPEIESNQRFQLKLDSFLPGLSTVNFNWNYLDQVYQMKFVSGFLGIIEQKNTLNANINWMILHPVDSTSP